LRSHKEFQSWKKVEEDMRAAGYPEASIQKARESYCQGMDLFCRIIQRMSSNVVTRNEISRTTPKSV